MNTVKIAVHSAEGCCTATTMALTSSKQNYRKLVRKFFVNKGFAKSGACLFYVLSHPTIATVTTYVKIIMFTCPHWLICEISINPLIDLWWLCEFFFYYLCI